jgi:pyruvate, water dikinase
MVTSKEDPVPAALVLPFSAVGIDDVELVGGKNASLGELFQQLTPAGVPVPDGFAITADAYRFVLDQANAWDALHQTLDALRADDTDDLARRAASARRIVEAAGIPRALREEILASYRGLCDEYGAEVSVAVRSSATAEDLPTASFAGQQETFLNVRGEEQLLTACQRCFASLFTDRAIHYRVERGFDHFRVGLSIGVQRMVRSDLAASGTMFTLDTESGFRDVVLINSGYGLGENVVQGTIAPDEFSVFKPTLEQGHRHVLRRSLGSKKYTMVFAEDSTAHTPLGTPFETTRNLDTAEDDRARYSITDDEALQLADYAIAIEGHYSRRAGRPMPMDIEWAKDGLDGKLYVVQARPETVASQRATTTIERHRLTGRGEVIATGRAVGSRVGVGPARVVSSPDAIREFQPGEVLITETTTPDWEPIMKRAAAIVTNQGGRTCHAAIVARELGIPAVIGCEDATETVATGTTVTVSCADGEIGRVYAGSVPFDVTHIDTSALERPHTKMMLILANPETAMATSFLPNDGVGLARMEFIITEEIKAHPMALVHPDRVIDDDERDAIKLLTRGYPSPTEFFVDKLAEGVATIAAAFYPKPVIVRTSDFKTNEYASLLGGRAFEPKEENPMLGFRGASRYAHPAYEEGFALECRAMKRVRDELGLTNVKLMIPFCRRVDEAQRTIDVMRSHGLERGVNGLEIYVMCEIPNNVILIDEFAALFDGFSIGSNDLTQLTLGVDRDSSIVAFDFDERDAGVKKMIELAVQGCKRNARHSGLCGQAPSDYPEMAEFLVRLGIDSISLNPDVIFETTKRVLELEDELRRS